MEKHLGIKELVKQGKLTAESAANRLLAKADLSGGKIGVELLRATRTFRWLANRRAV
jgi:hypothetical protein